MDENSKKTALRETLQSLRTPGELYVIMSGATKLPFVVCNPETFDDEILLYHREEDAKGTDGGSLSGRCGKAGG